MRWVPFALMGLVIGMAASGAMLWFKQPPDPVFPLKISGHAPAAPKKPDSADQAVASKPKASPIVFTDISDSMKIDFVSFSGTTPDREFPTANGTGVAMIDFDQDGWLDLYFASGCRLDQDEPAPPNALYRSKFGTAFEPVTEASGTAISGYTQGLTAGDVNNDGFPDLYLIRYGTNILLENNGDGTFRNTSDISGTADPRWGTSAAFLDYDADGALDFYVANYGKWDLNWHREHFCGRDKPYVRIYCSPKLLDAEVHSLYRSLGDGRFIDVASELGIARTDGRGQGVVSADVNNDGLIDLYVANDLTPNFLFVNLGGGRFEDATETSCAAYNERGEKEASMGVDAGDVDGDGLAELFVTNFYNEHNTLYKNLGSNLFQDVSNWWGVAAGSIQAVGWGTAFVDLDYDGWMDILVVNGHVDDNAHELGRDEPYAQKAAVWRNRGKGRFEKLDEPGPYFQTAHVSRGAAFGDLQNRGQIDVVITHKDERPTILRNDTRARQSTPHRWIQLALVGTSSNRDAVGTRVEIEVGDQRISRQIRGGASYLSAHDLRLTVGLGETDQIDRMEVHWPSGRITSFEKLATDQAMVIREPVN